MEQNMFSVTPVEQRVYLDPGQTYEGTVKIANPAAATADFSYKVSVLPYAVIGEDYKANLTTYSEWTKIVDWTSLDKNQGTLAPNDENEIHYIITVPADASPGAQYAAIVVTQDTDESSGSGAVIENIVEIASVIYAEVSGEAVHDANILENTVPGFVNAVPVTVSAKMDNHGNVMEESTVAIKVRNVITGEEILPRGENTGQYNELILPDTTRQIDRDVSDLPILGIVNIEQTIYYNGQVSTVGRDVVICPVWFIALVIFVIGAIIGIVIKVIKNRKKKKSEMF